MQEKYGSIAELNRAWRAAYASFDEVHPFRRSRQPSRTAWLDMMDWYHGSMTEFSAFWMDLCRRNFPGLPVYLCTGGTEPPSMGRISASRPPSPPVRGRHPPDQRGQ